MHDSSSQWSWYNDCGVVVFCLSEPLEQCIVVVHYVDFIQITSKRAASYLSALVWYLLIITVFFVSHLQVA